MAVVIPALTAIFVSGIFLAPESVKGAPEIIKPIDPKLNLADPNLKVTDPNLKLIPNLNLKIPGSIIKPTDPIRPLDRFIDRIWISPFWKNDPPKITVRWELPLNRAWVDSPLAVGEDGTLYFTTDTWGLYAINPDRTQKWGLTIGESKGIPAFGSDGTIYVNSYVSENDQRLLAIAPDGSVKWKFIRVSSSNSIRNSETSSPAVAADGTIYTGGSRDYKLYAVNPDDGTKKWEYKAASVVNTPVVGPDGTIYFESYKNLYAIRPNGTKKWILPSNRHLQITLFRRSALTEPSMSRPLTIPNCCMVKLSSKTTPFNNGCRFIVYEKVGVTCQI